MLSSFIIQTIEGVILNQQLLSNAIKSQAPKEWKTGQAYEEGERFETRIKILELEKAGKYTRNKYISILSWFIENAVYFLRRRQSGFQWHLFGVVYALNDWLFSENTGTCLYFIEFW